MDCFGRLILGTEYMMTTPDIRELRYSTGAADTVGIRGVTKIRLAVDGEEEIAGSGGYLTTYVVEKNGFLFKIVPGWMVTVEYVW